MSEPDPLLDPLTKGLPPAAGPLRLSEVGAQGWRLLEGDLPLPAAVLGASAMAGNSRWMQAFLARTGARLAPHGKTTMSPELFALQLADGAWGLTLATAGQVKVALATTTVRRVILANELASRHDIVFLLEALRADPGLEIYVLADSLEGARRLASEASARAVGRPLGVLVEIGYAGGRAGCRDLDAALSVARAVATAGPGLALSGVEAFEGLNQSLPAAEGEARVAALLADVVSAAEAIDAEGLFGGPEVILTAGGSAFYDMVAERFGALELSRPTAVVLRSGCYISHDSGLYERSFGEASERSALVRGIPGGLKNALEVWAYVLSVPEPGRAILGAGRRDFGHDAGPPRPLKHHRPGRAAPEAAGAGWQIAAINDQHAHMTFAPADDVAVGDMVALGPWHPCTTFDKWRLILVADDDYRIVSAVRTFF